MTGPRLSQPPMSCWCFPPREAQHIQRPRETVNASPKDQPLRVDRAEQGRAALEGHMEISQPGVVSQRPQLLGLQPSATTIGHNLRGQFQSSADCWECMFEQSLYSLYSNSGAGI